MLQRVLRLCTFENVHLSIITGNLIYRTCVLSTLWLVLGTTQEVIKET